MERRECEDVRRVARRELDPDITVEVHRRERDVAIALDRVEGGRAVRDFAVGLVVADAEEIHGVARRAPAKGPAVHHRS